MIDKPIEFTKLSLNEMFKLYNARAVSLGRPKMHAKPKDRVAMGMALALLMTQKVKDQTPAPKNSTRQFPSAVRDVAIEELCKIDCYEETAGGKKLSVGFAYSIVLKRIKKRLPKSKITGPALRLHANYIRTGACGYDRARLPDKRPHSNRKDKRK